MQFRKVIGQEEAKKGLIQTVKDGRISHAQLFFGPAGAGALPLALAYAQYITCEHRTEDDSCGTCSSCKQISALQYPDLHFSFPYIKHRVGEVTADDHVGNWKKMIQESPYADVQQWRYFVNAENKQLTFTVDEAANINKKIWLKSFTGGYKFIVIWLPEFMTLAVSNKLLKSIEEPPEKTIFLMVTENQEALLATITSRTQLVKVPRLSDDDVRSAVVLRDGVISNEKVEQLVQMADGNYFKAWQKLHLDQEDLHFNQFVAWMRMCYKKDVAEMVKFANEMHASGRENMKEFLDFATFMARQCIVGNYTDGKLSRFGPREADFAQKFAPFINSGNIAEIAEELQEAYYDISGNVYGKTVLLDLSLKMHGLLRRPVESL
ncbi:MAG: DNA polymerase III subunit delta' [Flavobacteriales bacterium]|nr:DNA polymerase III subunit delta' [Flavobacteriales bacterium]